MKYDPLTYRHPRTIKEAFGPYTGDNLESPDRGEWELRVIIVACIVCVMTVAGILLLEF